MKTAVTPVKIKKFDGLVRSIIIIFPVTLLVVFYKNLSAMRSMVSHIASFVCGMSPKNEHLPAFPVRFDIFLINMSTFDDYVNKIIVKKSLFYFLKQFSTNIQDYRFLQEEFYFDSFCL